ncbi:hypothetical protein SDC49_07380 [Lactobacillus sp. R2/2]|nr:hypothetical protein [Lactobacillus sp. R2/2]
MQSKRNLKNTITAITCFLIIIGIVLILAVVFGVVSYNNHVEAQKQAKAFATNHFNPNVNIYGVEVGNLTINKATAKINRKANNIVSLKTVKLHIERDPSSKTIKKQEVAAYFKKQHTTMPNKQSL